MTAAVCTVTAQLALGKVFPLSLHKDEGGTSLIEAALLAPLMLLMLLGAVDLGRASYIAVEVASAAQSGALYGVQSPSDTSGMMNAAALDAGDLPAMTTAVTYGCECSDGTSASTSCGTEPICSFNVVNYVDVNTTATYNLILPYPGLPQSLVLKGRARMRASH